MNKSLYISPYSRCLSLLDATPLMWDLMGSLGMAEGSAPARRALPGDNPPMMK